MKMGRLDEAHIDLENVVRKEPDNEEANRLYSMIDTLKENLQNAISYLNWHNYEQAIELFGELLEVRNAGLASRYRYIRILFFFILEMQVFEVFMRKKSCRWRVYLEKAKSNICLDSMCAVAYLV